MLRPCILYSISSILIVIETNEKCVYYFETKGQTISHTTSKSHHTQQFNDINGKYLINFKLNCLKILSWFVIIRNKNKDKDRQLKSQSHCLNIVFNFSLSPNMAHHTYSTFLARILLPVTPPSGILTWPWDRMPNQKWMQKQKKSKSHLVRWWNTNF